MDLHEQKSVSEFKIVFLFLLGAEKVIFEQVSIYDENLKMKIMTKCGTSAFDL